MASYVTREEVAKLYVATFNRAPDADGLDFWVNHSGMTIEHIAASFFEQPEAMLRHPDILDDNVTENEYATFVNDIYLNMFDRGADAEGLAYWTQELVSGNIKPEKMILAIMEGAQDVPEKGIYDKTILENKAEVGLAYADAGLNGTDFSLSQVREDHQTVEDALDLVNHLAYSPEVFTLKKNIDVTSKVVVEDGHTEIMWGDPHGGENSISAKDFFGYYDAQGKYVPGYLYTLTGLDLHELGVSDIDGTAALEHVSINMIGGMDGTTLQYQYQTADGEQFKGEVAIADKYVDFLDSILFYTDPETGAKVSRFSSKYVEGKEKTVYTYHLTPVVLTPKENNGGTMEEGNTSAKDNVIVAGQTELLHGAYIDGGDGHDTLEVDLKGVYAQPKAILNVEEIHVQNLPNVYDDYYNLGKDDHHDGLDIPDYDPTNTNNKDSILDLSRALDIQKLVVTEGFHTGTEIGDMTIVGVRNGAELVLEGSFTEDRVTVVYGEGIKNGIDVTLNLGDTGSTTFDILGNSNTININSIGGGNMLKELNFAGSEKTVMDLNISGDAQLYIEGSLSGAFAKHHVAKIDASANTANVNLNMDDFDDKVEFVGTAKGDDVFSAKYNEKSVVIQGGDGNNEFDVSHSKAATVSAGNGDNTVKADNSEKVTIAVGDGNNVIHALNQSGSSVAVTAGNGDNTARIQAETITFTSGEGDDTLYLSGNDTLPNYSVYHSTVTENGLINNAALINLDLGAGDNTVVFDNQGGGQQSKKGLTAKEGSTIKGENLTLKIVDDTDLTQASLQGVSHVVLTHDADKNGHLALTAEQFEEIGAANFDVQHNEFGHKAVVEIVVDHDMNLDELGDLSKFDCEHIDLKIDVACGATLTLTAEQLDKYIAEGGIKVMNDNADNQVVVTDAGYDFDAFHDAADDGITGGGTIVGVHSSADVTVVRTEDGYERPAEDQYSDKVQIDSDQTPVLDGISSLAKSLVVTGDEDITFTGKIALKSDDFNVDFSQLKGVAHNLTISNFEKLTASNDYNEWGTISGNGTAANPARVNIEMTSGKTVGDTAGGVAHGGFKSSGVQEYVVTSFLDQDGHVMPQTQGAYAHIVVCDQTQDLEVLGLQNNRHASVVFDQVNWGTQILLEGDGYANASEQEKNLGNPDLSEIGSVTVNYFEPGANAVINITNQGTQLGMDEDAEDGYDPTGERKLDVAGISVSNADKVVINVSDGDAVIHTVDIGDADRLLVNGVEDVTLELAPDASLATLDATGVQDKFTLDLIDDGHYNFSATALSGIDSIQMEDRVSLTLNADQVVQLGSSIVDEGTDTVLNVNGLSDQPVDLSAIDVDHIGIVTTADVDGTIVLDPATNLGGAKELVILAHSSDTTLQMTEAQYNSFCADVNSEGHTQIACSLKNGASEQYKATLVLTDVANDAPLYLGNQAVGEGLDVVVKLSDFTATDDFLVTAGNHIESLVLELDGGTVDLTKMQTAGSFDLDNMKVHFTQDTVLDVTAAQLAAMMAHGDPADEWIVDSGVNVTLNVSDLNSQALDLDALAALGIHIGTVSIEDSNHLVTINPHTTFGGADQIVTPTADQNDAHDGLEPTVVQMTVQQLASSDGVVTGDAQINLSNLVNNVDTDHAIPYTPDVADYDLSGIAHPGVLYLGQDTVTLSDTANLGGFEIRLDDGQMIQFATEAQADGAKVVEMHPGTTTAVAWLFDSVTQPVDTSKYDGNINTLFVNEDLVDGKTEESLWTGLSGSIDVEKVNANDIPDVLVGHDLVNTFEALSSVDGINYDDQDEFSSIEHLTLNLEGNTNIGDIKVGDTNNQDDSAIFDTLTINSYEDRSTLQGDTGFVMQPNKIGNITLNSGSMDSLDNILISTKDHFYDEQNVNQGAAYRDGLAVEIGTIQIASGDPEVTSGTITLQGDHDITIAGIDMSDPEVTLVTVQNHVSPGVHVKIGGDEYAANLYMVDGHTAQNGETLGTSGDDALIVAGGDNDLTKATLDIESVSFTGDATLTLTADQVQQIGFADANHDGVADDWAANGHNVTLNIVGLDSSNDLDLNSVAAAGINIGTVSTAVDQDVTLQDSTTLGGADAFVVELQDHDRTLTMTAEQYKQVAGNITEHDADTTVANKAAVTITDLDGIATDTDGDNVVDTVHVDFSNVQTTGNHRVELADVNHAADLTMDATTNLTDFTVVLDSQGTALNDLAGQTVRFSTQEQASRPVDVINDDGASDNATNVVWLFNSVNGKVDTSDYDSELGRVWMLESLVNGQNVEELYTHLSQDTIIRVVNEEDLSELLPTTTGFDRHVEVESFTSLPGGLTFNDIDEANHRPFDFVENLTVDMGGNVTIGDLAVDNILAEPVSNDDEFDTLTINSFKADASGEKDYLLPEDWDGNVNPRPDAPNKINDIKSGSDHFDLGRVVINTGTAGHGGNALIAHEIFFSDDGDGLDHTTDPHVAEFVVTGDSDVTVKSLDTSDADITGLSVDASTYSGTLTVTGGSPAFDGGMAAGNTETLEIKMGTEGIAKFGTATDSDHHVPYAGIAGEELSEIIVTGGGSAKVDLGTIALIDSNNDDTNGDGTPDRDAFTLKGADITTAKLGTANVNGTLMAPSLDAGSTWDFEHVDLTITDDVVFHAGATLDVKDSELRIDGDVDMTVLGTNFDYSGSTVYVAAGDTLKMDIEQLKMLDTSNVHVEGEGTVVLVGNADNYNLATMNYVLETAHVDMSAVTITSADMDSAVDAFTFAEAQDDQDPAQPTGSEITGSAADDIIFTNDQDDKIFGGAGDDILVGNDGNDDLHGDAGDDQLFGDVGDDILTGGAGDDYLYGGSGSNTWIVDAGTDHVLDLNSGDDSSNGADTLLVSAGAKAIAILDSGAFFIATSDTKNDGTANLSGAVNDKTTIDVSAATGSQGFSLDGGGDDNSGVASGDVLIGSDQDDHLNGGNDMTQEQADADTLTGNGGADTFEFNLSVSDPAPMSQNTSTANVDEEIMKINGVDSQDDNDETITVNYVLNGIGSHVSITDPNIDVTDVDAVGNAIRLALNGVDGITATYDSANDEVHVKADDNGSFSFGTTTTGGTWQQALNTSDSNGTDTAQVTDVTIDNTAPITIGEQYTLKTTLAEGSVLSITHTVAAADDSNTDGTVDASELAAALAADYNNATPGDISASNANNVITLTDQDADNGGFSVKLSSQGVFNGSGASNGTDLASADTITDFTSGEDKIDLGNLPAGTATNYKEGATVADFSTALSNANTAFDGTVQYYLTAETADHTGVLFFDANLDGTADGVIALTGVDADHFAASDIIA